MMLVLMVVGGGDAGGAASGGGDAGADAGCRHQRCLLICCQSKQRGAWTAHLARLSDVTCTGL